MCFFLSKKVDSETPMQLWLYLDTLQKTSGFGRLKTKINYTSFISAIKGITSRITWLNATYSASVVLKSVSVYNLLHNNNGNPTYLITYPVQDIPFFSLLASS